MTEELAVRSMWGEPQRYARIAGVLGLFIVVAGIFAEGFVRGGVIVTGDAVLTADNIMNSSTLFRSGMVVELLMLSADIAYAVLLYALMRPAGAILARMAVAFRLVMASILGCAALLQLSAIMVFQQPEYLDVFSEAQKQALSLYALRLHAGVYHIALVFFAAHLVLLGVLVMRSGYVPKCIGAGLLVAAFCYLINASASLLALGYAKYLFPWILLPCLVAETSLTLWLLVKGVNQSLWQQKAAMAAIGPIA